MQVILLSLANSAAVGLITAVSFLSAVRTGLEIVFSGAEQAPLQVQWVHLWEQFAKDLTWF